LCFNTVQPVTDLEVQEVLFELQLDDPAEFDDNVGLDCVPVMSHFRLIPQLHIRKSYL